MNILILSKPNDCVEIDPMVDKVFPKCNLFIRCQKLSVWQYVQRKGILFVYQDNYTGNPSKVTLNIKYDFIAKIYTL